jgi:hypothetical protein
VTVIGHFVMVTDRKPDLAIAPIIGAAQSRMALAGNDMSPSVLAVYPGCMRLFTLASTLFVGGVASV